MQSLASQLQKPGLVRDGAFVAAILLGLMALHYVNVSFSASV